MTSYVLVAGHAGVAALIAAAAGLGGPVVALVAGPRSLAEQVACAAVDQVVWFGEPGDQAVESFAPAVARVVAEQPGIVLGGRRPAERVLLGWAAAALAAPVVTGVTGVTGIVADGGQVVVTHGVNGGIAVATTAFEPPVAIQLDGGAVPSGSGSAPITEVAAAPLPIVVESVEASRAGETDLTAAPRVVGVGRGLRAREDLALVEALADALDAEIGCTRPLAEGLDWLPRDRYLGVSGQHIAPELYLALGISGQLQHVAGTRAAGTVVAVNTDPKAPIMAEADYLLAGDLYTLVPALLKALGT